MALISPELASARLLWWESCQRWMHSQGLVQQLSPVKMRIKTDVSISNTEQDGKNQNKYHIKFRSRELQDIRALTVKKDQPWCWIYCNYMVTLSRSLTSSELRRLISIKLYCILLYCIVLKIWISSKDLRVLIAGDFRHLCHGCFHFVGSFQICDFSHKLQEWSVVIISFGTITKYMTNLILK